MPDPLSELQQRSPKNHYQIDRLIHSHATCPREAKGKMDWHLLHAESLQPAHWELLFGVEAHK
jgi:hypothetical protein